MTEKVPIETVPSGGFFTWNGEQCVVIDQDSLSAVCSGDIVLFTSGVMVELLHTEDEK